MAVPLPVTIATSRLLLRRALQSVLAVVAVVVAYALAALILGLIPVNRDYVPAKGGIEILLVSNGIHSGLALPIANEVVDWRPELTPPSLGAVPATGFVVVGWGDQGIYTMREGWASLTPMAAITALLGLNRTVLRAEHFGRITSRPGVHAISVTPEGYAELATYIRATLSRDPSGRPIALPEATRYSGDAFYLANGRFSALRTCNEWVRGGLAAAGVRTAMWAPLDRPLFWQLSRSK